MWQVRQSRAHTEAKSKASVGALEKMTRSCMPSNLKTTFPSAGKYFRAGLYS